MPHCLSSLMRVIIFVAIGRLSITCYKHFTVIQVVRVLFLIAAWHDEKAFSVFGWYWASEFWTDCDIAILTGIVFKRDRDVNLYIASQLKKLLHLAHFSK